MQRKAEGMPVNVVITAAIALVVLVVLVAIFTGRLNVFGRDLVKTTDKYCLASSAPENTPAVQIYDGQWFADTEPCPPNTEESLAKFVDQPARQHCCVPVS